MGAATVSNDLIADHDRHYSRPALSDEKIALLGPLGPPLSKLVKGATSAFESMSEKTREDLLGKLSAFTSMAEDNLKVPEAQRNHSEWAVHTLWFPKTPASIASCCSSSSLG